MTDKDAAYLMLGAAVGDAAGRIAKAMEDVLSKQPSDPHCDEITMLSEAAADQREAIRNFISRLAEIEAIELRATRRGGGK